MSQIWFAIALATNYVSAPKPFPVQFATVLMGRPVTVYIDGKVERTFAGKMGFRDENRSWQSVCADVRSPVHAGQFFAVQPLRSSTLGGGYMRAGNIVAHCFGSAITPDQCAALQIAVWKAIEDDAAEPNFLAGHFQAQATPSVMALAAQDYQTGNTPGNSLFLYAGGGGGQSQMTPPENL